VDQYPTPFSGFPIVGVPICVFELPIEKHDLIWACTLSSLVVTPVMQQLAGLEVSCYPVSSMHFKERIYYSHEP
jgi:hypothetical protein